MKSDAAARVRFDLDRSAEGKLKLAGVDEAGRGSWAGPVVAAAVILPAGCVLDGLDDSKRLRPEQREDLFGVILAEALAWRAVAESAATVDTLNVLRASLKAMARAVSGLRIQPDLVLVDGPKIPDLVVPAQAVVGGDGRSAAIAAASVVAKVLRDRVMRSWDRFFPEYGFAEHKGYGSARHRQVLRRLGPCPLHRRSYRPVAELRQGCLWHEPR